MHTEIKKNNNNKDSLFALHGPIPTSDRGPEFNLSDFFKGPFIFETKLMNDSCSSTAVI